MTTRKQDQELANILDDEFSESLADDLRNAMAKTISAFFYGSDYAFIVEWIGDNMMPEDVFDERALETWAIKNGYEKGV